VTPAFEMALPLFQGSLGSLGVHPFTKLCEQHPNGLRLGQEAEFRLCERTNSKKLAEPPQCISIRHLIRPAKVGRFATGVRCPVFTFPPELCLPSHLPFPRWGGRNR